MLELLTWLYLPRCVTLCNGFRASPSVCSDQMHLFTGAALAPSPRDNILKQSWALLVCTEYDQRVCMPTVALQQCLN